MIPHHQNAVNMCKALFKSGELTCEDLENEEDPHCIMKLLCYEIINGQNFQIQTMRGVLDALDYDSEDDCQVNVSGATDTTGLTPKTSKTSKTIKLPKKMKK